MIKATTNARQKDPAYTTAYTLRGNLTSTSRYGDGSQSWNPGSWNWLFYDDTGSVVKTHDPRYVWGTAVPDASKNYAVPSSVTVAGLSSTMGWSDALGLTSSTGANGESSGTGYNTSYFVGRPASKTLPTGLTVTYGYTQNTVTETVNSTPVTRFTRTTMDGFGRPRLVESGHGSTVVSVVESEYEPCACTPIGKLKRSTRPYAPGGTKYWTVHNYDALGRTVSVVAPDGASTSSYVYEGASVKTVDAKGKWKRFVKDAVGNLTSVWEPSPVGGADLESTYSYDQFDRLTAVTKLRNSTAQTRTFTYGVQGLASKIEPETGSSTFYYRSADGRVHYQLDAKGQKIEPWYEDDLTPGFAQKRVAQIRKYPNGSTEDLCQRVEMFYDGAVPTGGDAGVSSFSAGRLSGVRYQGSGCAQTFVEQYSYTNYGAIVKKRVKMIRGAASGVLESVAEYDGEGRLKSVTYPVTNRKVQYGFNSRGLPETLTDVNAGTLIVSSVSYGVAGEVTNFVSGGGTETRSYNVNGQLTTLTLPGRTIAYNYPAAGQNNGKIESMTESGETISYQYDSLQRLTTATGSGWGQSYGYDVFGNMNAKTGSGSAPSWSGTIDAATNRLTAGVSYDANGNQTNVPLIAGSEMPDALTSMVYDVSNRLIRAENNGATRRGEYDYDPGNKRIYEKRSLNSVVSGEWAYFFGITGQRMGRYTFTVAGSAITFSQAQASVWFGGKLVQKFEGGTPSFPSEDRLGSVGKYLPYGESRAGSTPAADNEKFATYTRDAGTGLDYADQRWHVAGSGRFLTSDPYQASGGPADPGSWNRFGYVGGDPVGSNDRSGLLAEEPYDDWFGPHWWLWEYITQKGGGLACLSGACYDINGPMPVVRTGKWETRAQRDANIAILQAALAEAVRRAFAEDLPVFVTHLVLTADCALGFGANGGRSRYRRYEAYQGTRRLTMASVSIQEHFLQTNGSPSVVIPRNQTTGSNGVFEDTVGHPLGHIINAQYYQYFTASVAGSPYQGIPVPVVVSGPNPNGSVPGVYAAFSVLFSGSPFGGTNVSFNGDSGFQGLPECPPSVRPF